MVRNNAGYGFLSSKIIWFAKQLQAKRIFDNIYKENSNLLGQFVWKNYLFKTELLEKKNYELFITIILKSSEETVHSTWRICKSCG